MPEPALPTDPQSPGTSAQPPLKVVVIGGGVAGLAAAHRVLELAPQTQVTLLEAADRVGGILRTDQIQGFSVEQGADSFLINLPWAKNLCERIGIAETLVPTNDQLRQTYVVCRGKLEKVPTGFLLMSPTKLRPLLTSPILSWRGKARLLAETLIPRRKVLEDEQADESLASFASRRLGREVFQRLVQPLAAGIYSADAQRLSLAATQPRFIESEQQHRSLILAAYRERRKATDTQTTDTQSSGARYSQFVSPQGGMQRFPEAIAARLPAGVLQLQTAVTQISLLPGGGWSIAINQDSAPLVADKLILATSLPMAARLLQTIGTEVATQTAAQAAAVEHASMAIVTLGMRSDQFTRMIDGFGYVSPAIENRRVLATSISSHKFPWRAPEGHTLVRVFIGGAGQAALVDLADADLQQIAIDELRDLLGFTGSPQLALVSRWRQAMPQYHIGHQQRIAALQASIRSMGNIALAGNALNGVGIPQVVRSGESAASEVLGLA